MKQEQIKIFIDALSNSRLSEMEFSEDGWSLRLVKRGTARPSGAQATVALAPDHTAFAAGRGHAPAVNGNALAGDCLAPLYGIVHLQPSPGEPPFVQPGQRIASGQTLCVIEAMKVFNEVRADRDGVVAEVLVQSGDEVEAGQALFRLD